ncbi:MAG: methylated-DNA--[Clostridia bacterium]|nr:methylated-DNA--[protein]-cysteine S-methyltransferase [Clostridia bacterium]
MYGMSFGTPIGIITIQYDDEYLLRLLFGRQGPSDFCDNEICRETMKQIHEYFSGRRRHFDIKYRLEGSPLAVNVWRAVAGIPFGQTRTYSEIAAAAHNEKAVRAAASCVGKNPLPVIIPCHRVIRKSGDTGNYSGGAAAKRFLLELEGNKF